MTMYLYLLKLDGNSPLNQPDFSLKCYNTHRHTHNNSYKKVDICKIFFI